MSGPQTEAGRALLHRMVARHRRLLESHPAPGTMDGWADIVGDEGVCAVEDAVPAIEAEAAAPHLARIAALEAALRDVEQRSFAPESFYPWARPSLVQALVSIHAVARAALSAPAAREADCVDPACPSRHLTVYCGHEWQFHESAGDGPPWCGCEGDGEAGLCACTGYQPAPEPVSVEALARAIPRARATPGWGLTSRGNAERILAALREGDAR